MTSGSTAIGPKSGVEAQMMNQKEGKTKSANFANLPFSARRDSGHWRFVYPPNGCTERPSERGDGPYALNKGKDIG